MNPLLLTPEQAKEQLGISRTKLFALIASGEIKSVKIGKSRRISQQALADYVAELEAGAA